MARYVISVGGTGQHIALALTRLVRAGAIEPDVRLIALDSDTDTPLPRKLAAPTPSLSGARHPLRDGVAKPPFDVARLGKKSFRELFVDADHPDEQELFECLFDESEAAIPVHRGMYGTPCVGATVFAEGSSGDTLANLLKPLATDASQAFVCGSVVGGTGAGIMHKLVGEIRRYYTRDIYGLFLLPWFDVPPTGGDGAINPATIARNASHGTKYFYEHTIPRLTASVLLGQPGVSSEVLRKIAVREGDMGEHPSYLHLAAARALVELPKAATANRGTKAYGMVHDLLREGWLLDETWESGRTLRQLVRALRVEHNLLQFLTHEKNRQKILAHYGGGLFSMSTADAWKPLDLSITANVRDKKQQRPFAEAVLARFDELRGECELVIAWAQELFPGALLDEPNDSLMAELSDAFRKSAESAFHWRKLQELWEGQELAADPNQPHDGSDVANHHARILFDQGLAS